MAVLQLIKNHGQCTIETPVVCLPGWGFDGRFVELCDKAAGWYYPEGMADPHVFADQLDEVIRQKRWTKVILLGWSMGALLAVDYLTRYPGKIEELYLLALRKCWPAGEIQKIADSLKEGPADFLKSFYRKCFLGYKAEFKVFQKNLQEQYIHDLKDEFLFSGLDYLARSEEIINRFEKCEYLPRNIFQFHGKKDLIAPVEERALLPGVRSHVFPYDGHAVFLSERFSIYNRKKRLRDKFSKAATTYDQYADVQKEAALHLAGLLPEKQFADTILEIGCGTGTLTRALKERRLQAKITAVDFSQSMLQQALNKLEDLEGVDFVCQDGEEYLDECNGPVDIVASNATFQWFNEIDQALVNVAKVLSDNGIFLLSIFGPESLGELRAALNAVMDSQFSLPASQFIESDSIVRRLKRIFRSVEQNEICYRRSFNSFPAILRQLQMTGTSGVHPHPPIFTKYKIEQIEKWLRGKYSDLSMSYQVVFFRCKK